MNKHDNIVAIFLSELATKSPPRAILRTLQRAAAPNKAGQMLFGFFDARIADEELKKQQQNLSGSQ